MNNKTRQGLWLVVGAYLAYTGVRLVMDVLSAKPDHYQLMAFSGIVFVIVGIYVAVRSIRQLVQPESEEEETEQNTESMDDNVIENEDGSPEQGAIEEDSQKGKTEEQE